MKLFKDLELHRRQYFIDQQVKNGTPARFFHNGQSICINTGEKASKGCNVMYQYVIWTLPRDVARELSKDLGLTVYF